MLSVTHQDLELTDKQLIDMYRFMVTARELDKRTWLLNRAGRIPFVVSCQGHEAVQVGAAYALNNKQDIICPYYRDLAMVLVYGMTANEIMLSNFAKAGDPNSRGRQMPGHFGCKRLGIITGSSPVTTQVPHAVGVALAAQMRGESTVVMVCFGEGSSNQGDFHEGINFAGVHNLPVIFLCQNNRYAISTPLDKQVAGKSVAARSAGYGIDGQVVDGNDVLKVYQVVKNAVDRARSGKGPTLIEALTYRLMPHTSDDDDTVYRKKEEVEQAKAEDPLIRFADYLNEQQVYTYNQQQDLLSEVVSIVDEAVDQAEAAEYPVPESALEHVYGKAEVK